MRSFLDGAPAGSFASHEFASRESVDADRGRIETRRAFVSHDVGWITSGRRLPGE